MQTYGNLLKPVRVSVTGIKRRIKYCLYNIHNHNYILTYKWLTYFLKDVYFLRYNTNNKHTKTELL